MEWTSSAPWPPAHRRLRRLVATAVVFALVALLAQPVGAREHSAFDAIPKVTADSGIDSGPALLYSAAWGVPAGSGICSAVFADGIPTFGEPVAHLPLHPVDVTLWKAQKPRAVHVQGIRVIAGAPFGSAEDVAYELARSGRSAWVVRINPAFVGQYLVTIDARWSDRSPCAMGQEGSWSLSLQTLTEARPAGS